MPLYSNVSAAILLAAIPLAIAGATLTAVGIVVAVAVALEVFLAIGAMERAGPGPAGSE